MIANDGKSYLCYLNMLVAEFSNTYHHSIVKKTSHAYYSAMSKETEWSHKAPESKVGVRITKYKNNFSKGYTEMWSKVIFVIDSVLNINPWIYKNTYLSGETIMSSLHEKNCK